MVRGAQVARTETSELSQSPEFLNRVFVLRLSEPLGHSLAPQISLHCNLFALPSVDSATPGAARACGTAAPSAALAPRQQPADPGTCINRPACEAATAQRSSLAACAAWPLPPLDMRAAAAMRACASARAGAMVAGKEVDELMGSATVQIRGEMAARLLRGESVTLPVLLNESRGDEQIKGTKGLMVRGGGGGRGQLRMRRMCRCQWRCEPPALEEARRERVLPSWR